MAMDEIVFSECLNKKETEKSWNQIAKENGFQSGDALRSVFRREVEKRQRNTDSNVQNPENMAQSRSEEIRSDGSIVSERIVEIRDCDSKNPEILLKLHGFDPNEWDLISAKNNFWQGLQKGGVETTTLYQSKIICKPKNKKIFDEQDLEKYFSSSTFSNFSIEKPMYQYDKNGLVLEIALADLHVGNDSVTFDEVKRRVSILISEIKERSKSYKFSKILFVQMGDVAHFDGYNRQTTSGTQITTPTSYYQMWENAVNILIWMVEELSNVSPVELVNIYGNHDKITSYTLGKAIEFYFSKNKNVVVDAGQSMRKFKKFGNNLVYFVHGDMPKANLYYLLQKEARKEFGETKFAEIHVGHLHHEHSVEKDGVITRWLPSMTSPDEWHYSEGYTGSKPATCAFVWDLEIGLKEQWWINI